MLVSKEADEDLSLKESLGVRLHVLMCGACRNYRCNIRFLQRACKAMTSPSQTNSRSPEDMH